MTKGPGRRAVAAPAPAKIAPGTNGTTMLARIAIAAALAATLLATAAEARILTLLKSHPAVEEVISGAAVAFALRFDHPVDHQSGAFVLVTPQGTRDIRPRLDSEPEVLYAEAGDLAPGRYELRWRARPAEGGDQQTTGSIAFQVR
jgi:methionine-rich copper-binding protein CopC